MSQKIAGQNKSMMGVSNFHLSILAMKRLYPPAENAVLFQNPFKRL
jgi:hypothetical protein